METMKVLTRKLTSHSSDNSPSTDSNTPNTLRRSNESTASNIIRRLSTPRNKPGQLPKPSVDMSGWLLKQSKSKYNVLLQNRFVRIYHDRQLKAHFIEYFKNKPPDPTKPSETFEHRIQVDNIDWVRQFDKDSQVNRRFEFKCGVRVYLFEAASVEEMNVWIQSIRLAIDLATEVGEVVEVKLYEEQGEEALKQMTRINMLDNLSSELKDNAISNVSKAIQSSIQYLVSEIEKKIVKTKRYDVLKASVQSFVAVIAEYLQPVISETNTKYLQAKLGELHVLITALTSMDNHLSSIYYGPDFPPVLCDFIMEILPSICDRYVNGSRNILKGSVGYLEGAAHQLHNAAKDVLQQLIKNPKEAIQCKSNRSLYTEVPIDIWGLLNDHMDLSFDTQCPVLEVLMAHKLREALLTVTDTTVKFVDSINSNWADLEEIVLELLCALTNDTATHIENICMLIERFDNTGIRDTVDELFKMSVDQLASCGVKCLRRLVEIVITDVEPLILVVNTQEWLSQLQECYTKMSVVTSTMADYCTDFEAYLAPFWLDRLLAYLVETVTLRYTQYLLFRDVRITKAASQNNQWAPIQFDNNQELDNESVMMVAKDLSALNGFIFSNPRAANASAALPFINDILDLLQINATEITDLITKRMKEYPHAAQAIYETGRACLFLRRSEFGELEKVYQLTLQPLMLQMNEEKELCQIDATSSDIGQLYSGLLILVSKGSNACLEETEMYAINLMYAPIEAFKTAYRSALADTEERQEEVEFSTRNNEQYQRLIRVNLGTFESKPGIVRQISTTQKRLVEKVTVVMDNQKQDLGLKLRQAEEESRRSEWMREKKIFLESGLDKASPGSTLIWQRRWFKLFSKPKPEISNNSTECPYTYTLSWSDKKGTPSKNSLEISSVISISILEAHIPLSYNFTRQELMLKSWVPKMYPNDVSADVKVKVSPSYSNTDVYSKHYVFQLKMNEKSWSRMGTQVKERLFRTKNVEKLLSWVNGIALAGSLVYDEGSFEWTRQAKVLLSQSQVTAKNPAKESGNSVITKPGWEQVEQHMMQMPGGIRESLAQSRTQYLEAEGQDSDDDNLDGTSAQSTDNDNGHSKVSCSNKTAKESGFRQVPTYGALSSSNSGSHSGSRDQNAIRVNRNASVDSDVSYNSDDDDSVPYSESRFDSSGSTFQSYNSTDEFAINYSIYQRPSIYQHQSPLMTVNMGRPNSKFQGKNPLTEESTRTNLSKGEADLRACSPLGAASVRMRHSIKSPLITAPPSGNDSRNISTPAAMYAPLDLKSSNALLAGQAQPPPLQGWLFKRARSPFGGYSWLRRFAYVDPPSCALHTADSEDDNRAKRKKEIDIRHVQVVPANTALHASASGKTFLGFTLYALTKQHVFDAPSAEEGTRWVQGLLQWQQYFKFHPRTTL